MQVFFATSARGTTTHTSVFEHIHNQIEANGHEHLAHWAETSDMRIYNNTQEYWSNLVEDAYLRIRHAECVIVETSIASTSLGLIIQQSLNQQKQVLALHDQNSTPFVLYGIQNEHLTVEKYTSINHITTLLAHYFQNLNNRTDIRFNMLLTANQLQSICHSAKKMGMSKSGFIRYLIAKYEEQVKN